MTNKTHIHRNARRSLLSPLQNLSFYPIVDIMYTGRDFRLLNETLKSHSDAGDNNGNKVTNVKKKKNVLRTSL